MVAVQKRRHNNKVLNKDIFNELLSDDVKRDVDITMLFRDFGVNLKQKGKSYIGLCPWHDDKNPSLSVDKEKGLYNCFSCGESGDAITLVEKIKGLAFKEALDFLKQWKTGSRLTLNIPKLEIPKIDDPDLDLKLDISDIKEPELPAATLNDVTEDYHRNLLSNKIALEYLKNRGITDYRIINDLKIGFSDGSLLNKLSKNHINELKKSGIIRENGQEHFSSFIIFPIFDDNNNTVSIYGRGIDPKSKISHLYLKGKHKGIFNRKVTKKAYDEVILTECIIDAVSLMQTGINNVQSIYGVNGFTGEHLQLLKADRVKTVILAFDNDTAGRKASESIKDKLVKEDFAVKVIFPPNKKDWNEELISKITKEQIQSLINTSKAFKKKESEEKLRVTYDNGLYIIRIEKITYKIAGIKDIFSPNLRVKVRCEIQDKQHRDNFDLYSYRARQNFSSSASEKIDVNAVKIEKDLDRILDYLEDEREKKVNPTAQNKENDILTDAEVKIGMDLLKSPDLINQTITDINNLGYAGEDNNKLLVYIIGISRFLPKPLSLFALSSPGTGKSYLVDTVLKLFPEINLKYNSSLSDQAFHYMQESDFDGNIFIMGESLHNPVIEGYIRQMQTENMLSRSVVKKDESTGEMKTVNITHKVRLVFMTTSTQPDPNIENISRCILLNIDESADQTDKVHKKQRYKRTHEGILADRHLIPDIIKKHISAQKLLKPIMIYNPFAEYIDFPKHKSLLRRSQEYFLITIESICYWRQYQKQAVKKFNPYLKIDEDWIECDFYDYELARKLFIECRLLSGIEDIPYQMVFLYEKIRGMLKKKAKQENLVTEDISFIQAEVRELEGLGMGNESIKRYIRMMVDFEVLQVIGGRRHKVKLSYKLREDKPIKKINVAEIIPTVDQIKEMMNLKN